jgi:hypothetical protein
VDRAEMEGSEQTQAHVPWFFFGIRLANRVAFE